MHSLTTDARTYTRDGTPRGQMKSPDIRTPKEGKAVASYKKTDKINCARLRQGEEFPEALIGSSATCDKSDSKGMAGALDPTGAICGPYDEGVGTRVYVGPWLSQPGEEKKR